MDERPLSEVPSVNESNDFRDSLSGHFVRSLSHDFRLFTTNRIGMEPEVVESKGKGLSPGKHVTSKTRICSDAFSAIFEIQQGSR